MQLRPLTVPGARPVLTNSLHNSILIYSPGANQEQIVFFDLFDLYLESPGRVLMSVDTWGVSVPGPSGREKTKSTNLRCAEG